MKAFPTEHPLSGYMDLMSDGMDLRDYFAIKIVQAMISNNKIYEMHPDEKSIVKDAYIVADYMMEARND